MELVPLRRMRRRILEYRTRPGIVSTKYRPAVTSTRCRVCGAALDDRRLDGLCPACTWRTLMEPEAAATVYPAAFVSLFPLPGHTVLEEVARGGMGIVYRAQQWEPNRMVALKMLLPQQLASEEMRELWLEARAISALDHPAILPIYHVGEHHGLPFFTMKYAAGGTLATQREQYVAQYRLIADLMATLADAVHFAHEHGILHRDLKPGNILFDDVGRPYVSDFGLAKFVGSNADLTESVHLLGTPHYLAPEVARRCARFATTASDLFSLGTILYELLAGRPPFEAEGIPDLLKKIAEEEPLPPTVAYRNRLETAPRSAPATTRSPTPWEPRVRTLATAQIPRDLEVICLKCLAKEPSRRYGSARELAEDLRRWLDGEPILARPASHLERLVRWIRRNPVIATLVGALLLALTIGAFTLAGSNLELQRTLHESLLTQARLERTSRRAGQRFAALALVDRATALRPTVRPRNDARRAALRTEAAGALSLPDLQPLASSRVHVGAWGSAVEFSRDLATYAAPAAEGGFSVIASTDHRVLRHFPAANHHPAVQFEFSPDGRWVAAVFQDGHAEVHALALPGSPTVLAGSAHLRADLEFLPGQRVLVAGGSQGLKVLDLETGTHRELVAPPVAVSALKADARGERVACWAQGALHVRRVAVAGPFGACP